MTAVTVHGDDEDEGDVIVSSLGRHHRYELCSQQRKTSKHIGTDIRRRPKNN